MVHFSVICSSCLILFTCSATKESVLSFTKKYYIVFILDGFKNWKKLQGAKRGGSRADATEKAKGSGWLNICGENRKESEIFDV